jgi:light-regulated signal transduction histidine kinase (bacteriophytochrome)
VISNSLHCRSPRVPLVRVSAKANAGANTFSVTGNDVGFGPQYQQQIFKMFNRLS